jgi:hypothetical protein
VHAVFRIFRIIRRLLVFGLVLFAGFTWWRFHPDDIMPVVGPAGSLHQAYVENRSFQDMGFTLCVSDWPHTFLKPISVGSVLGSEGPAGRVFWSADGSVIAVRQSDGYVAAYDYSKHQLLGYRPDRIEDLIQSRGGLGPELQEYPDQKDGDSQWWSQRR